MISLSTVCKSYKDEEGMKRKGSVQWSAIIMKTCFYNVYPLKPHFYIVKLGFTGGIHHFSYNCSKTQIVGTLQNCLGEAVLTSTHNLCFEQKYEKYESFLSAKLSIFGGEIFYIVE